MAANDVNSLDDLTDLFLANQNLLDEETRRIFRGILLELGKGEDIDENSLTAMVEGLEALLSR